MAFLLQSAIYAAIALSSSRRILWKFALQALNKIFGVAKRVEKYTLQSHVF
jgi:hypothetical protein